MAEGEKVTLTRAAWSADAEAGLMPAAFGDMAIIRAEVQAGQADLWRLGGSADGWLVTRQEDGELVLMCGAGKNAAGVIRHCLEVARKNGLTVRAHIRRPGMQRIYERAGFRLREWVMGSEHGQ